MTYNWNWKAFEGSELCLKWVRKDLANLEEALRLTTGRKIAVQAGGNLGIFAKRLAADFETVYTFEPDPNLFPKMVRNAPEANIVRFQAALGKERTYISTRYAHRDGSKAKHEGVTHVVENGAIPTMTIDELNLPACDLIYLDVEGYELFAVQGAFDTIEKYRPVVVLEINRCLEAMGFDREMMLTIMRIRGYELAHTARSDHIFVPRWSR
jgi:FkbM family methyltransferase